MQDQNGVPHCIPCHDHCNMVIPDNPANYMCGENGKTYKNTCELRADICKTGRSIRISHSGKCIGNRKCYWNILFIDFFINHFFVCICINQETYGNECNIVRSAFNIYNEHTYIINI